MKGVLDLKTKKSKLTFPKSDTISGPGTYQGVITKTKNKNEIPAVKTEGSHDEFGYGTAKDVTSQAKNPLV